MFEFATETLGMTPAEILNHYRNKYYTETLVTERGIVANAINDVLPNIVEVVRCKDCKYWQHEEDVDFVCTRHYGYRTSMDFCSYGERKAATPCMTDNEVTKALECCTQDGSSCRECCFDKEKAEILELREIVFMHRGKAIKNLKAEAIKEFAAKCLLKEMTEDVDVKL